MDEFRLFTYKMTHDTGFAPNPFHGILTLANCKPYMRKTKNTGDWIAGFSSKELNNDDVGYERLVYLMKVTARIEYREYWNNTLYKLKKPNNLSSNIIERAGDNIYKPTIKNAKLYTDFVQIENCNHTVEKDQKSDLNGVNVLVSNLFYYFGLSPLIIDKKIRPNVPKGPTTYGYKTPNEIAKKFIMSIKEKYPKGIINMPHKWPKKYKNASCSK